jgi:predicted esterase
MTGPNAEITNLTGFVHRFLPAPTPENAPTLLLLHGTGGNENDLLPLGKQLLSGANLLSLRGKVLENGMPRFFRRLAEGVFDQEDLRFRTDELAQFIAAAVTEYHLDAKRLFAVGYSNGANIAASLLLRQPDVLAGAVLLHPMVPFVPETLPDLSGKPIFIGAGRNDPIVPTANTTQLVQMLESAGAKVALHWHNGGHSLTQEELDAAKQWLSEQA